MFLRWRRHRSRKSAMSKIPSYIIPAQNTKPQKTRVGGDSQQPQLPQCHSPGRFLKQKAYVFVCLQTPESNPEAQGPGHPKTRNQKHVLEATPAAPQSRNATALPVSGAKSVCFRTHSNSGIKTRGRRPRAQTPWIHGSRAEAPGLRAQAPSSKI